MSQHLTVMSNMISELRVAGHEMINEQQVQAVIRSLPSNLKHMRVNLTHNDNIKTFDDVACHVELEEDSLLAEKLVQKAFMTENKSREAQGSGHNKGKGKGPQGKGGNEASYSGQKCKHGKCAGKRSKNKNCFNCSKPGHFARDCTQSKIMFNHNSPSNISIISCLILAETVPFWIVDSTTTDHIARDRISFVEFC